MEEHVQGPAMICATAIMKTGPARIGRIGSITFPRTVSIVTLFATGIGAVLGMGLGLAVASGLNSVIYGLIFGGGAGWFIVNYSPLQGESMIKWIELQFHATRRGRYIDGERVSLAVGVAVLNQTPRGKVRLMRSAVRIPSTQYDRRGVLISVKNQNLPTDGGIDPLLFAALSLPGESTMSMTPTGGATLGGAPAPAGREARGSRKTLRPAASTSAGSDATPASTEPSALVDLDAGPARRLKD